MAMKSDDFPQALVAQVQGILDTASKTGARVAAWDEVQGLLKQHKLAWSSQVAPEFVGIHPSNRSKLGVGGSEAHHHGAQILQAGFSWARAADAACFECPPGEKGAEAKSCNDRLVALSQGLIPPLAQIKYLSVGGGHTNTFLRAVKAGCPTVVPRLGDETGRLNAEQLTAGRSTFKDAVEGGLKWLVLHARCAEVWPDLAHFVQSALNTRPKSDQSEIEIMMDMHNAMQACEGEPNWLQIQEGAKHSMPPCSVYIHVLACYVKKYCGGPGGVLLEELSKYQKTFACSDQGPNRVLGSEFFSKINSLSFGVGMNLPYVVTAAIKANLISPSCKIVDGICRLLPMSALSLLTKQENRPQVLRAEQLMVDCRELCRVSDVSDEAMTKVVGKLDVRLILHICKKSKEGPEGVEFESIDKIAEAILRTS